MAPPKADPRTAVLEYLGSKGSIPGATPEEKLGYRYLDSGHIDSFGLIEMISHLEQTLGVRFEPKHMQSEEFRIVGGLIGILQKLFR